MTDQQQPVTGEGAPAQAAPEGSDLSGKTVLSLVVLTLVVSFIGAWASISQVMTATSASDGIAPPPSSEGRVSFSIEPPAPTQADTSSGMVAFEIASGG